MTPIPESSIATEATIPTGFTKTSGIAMEILMKQFTEAQRAADRAAIEVIKDNAQPIIGVDPAVKGVVVMAAPSNRFIVTPPNDPMMKALGANVPSVYALVNQTQQDLGKAKDQINRLAQKLTKAKEAAYLNAVSASIYAAAYAWQMQVNEELQRRLDGLLPKPEKTSAERLHDALSFGGFQRGGLRCDQV